MTKIILSLLAISVCSVGPGCNSFDARDSTAPALTGAGGSTPIVCALPPSALLPAPCVACIKAACPSTYADLCSANCGADEYGAACLSAQREIGTCLSDHPCFGCMMSHGSVYVGGAPGVSGVPVVGGAGAAATSTGGAGAAAMSTGGAGAAATSTGGAGAAAMSTGGAGAAATSAEAGSAALLENGGASSAAGAAGGEP